MKLIFSIIFICFTNFLCGKIVCVIKVEFGECSKCVKYLNNFDSIEKVFIFRDEFRGVEPDIISNVFLLDINKVSFITSDSIYNKLGFEGVTSIHLFDGKLNVFNIPLMKLTSSRKLIDSLLKHNRWQDSLTIKRRLHSQCQLILFENGHFVIFDKLLQQIVYIDNWGNETRTVNLDNLLKAKIYRNFYKDTSGLVGQTSLSIKILNQPLISLNSVNYYKGKLYCVFSMFNFSYSLNDSLIIKQYLIIGKFKEYTKEIDFINLYSSNLSEYQAIFDKMEVVISDTTIAFSILNFKRCEAGNPLSIIYKIRNDSLRFDSFSKDSLPDYFHKQGLESALNDRSQSNGFVAFAISGEIYFNNNKLDINLFRPFQFKGDFVNITCGIIDIESSDYYIFILYLKDGYFMLSKFNLKSKILNQYDFKIESTNVLNIPTISQGKLLYTLKRSNKIYIYKL